MRLATYRRRKSRRRQLPFLLSPSARHCPKVLAHALYPHQPNPCLHSSFPVCLCLSQLLKQSLSPLPSSIASKRWGKASDGCRTCSHIRALPRRYLVAASFPLWMHFVGQKRTLSSSEIRILRARCGLPSSFEIPGSLLEQLVEVLYVSIAHSSAWRWFSC